MTNRVASIAAVLVTAVAGLSSANNQTPPSVDLPAPLARVLTDYEKAWTAKNAKALASLFAEDGWVLSSGQPPVQGRAAIEQHYQNSGGPLSLRGLAYATEGKIGYIVGGFARRTRRHRHRQVHADACARTRDGSWLIYSDMDNGNARR